MQVTYYNFDTAYPYVRDAFNELKETGWVGYFEAQGMQYHDFDPDTKRRANQGPDAGYLYGCLDRDQRPTIAEIREENERLEETAPFLNRLVDIHGFDVPDEEYAKHRLGCLATWAAIDDPQIPDPPERFPLPTNLSGHPVLLVGTTGDNATPYAHAVEMAELLESPLLTYHGTGHANGLGSVPCVTEKVTAYLVDGVLPEAGASCGL